MENWVTARAVRACRGACCLLVAAGAVAGCGADAPSKARGKELFKEKCAVCHTLADAGATGTTGTDLDLVRPDKGQVEYQIEQGPGVMPENLVRGEDKEAVAEYVASAAGKSG